MFDSITTVRILAQAPYEVNENGTNNLVFVFDRAFGGFPSYQDYLTVQFALTGTADAGIDYTTSPNFNPGTGLNSDWGSITFYPGSSTATLTITPIADSITEGNETVTVHIVPTAAYNVGVTQLATGTIIDSENGGGDGGGGGARIVGTNGADELSGTNGRNRILGKGGNDVLIGYGGNDILLGHNGNDILIGGSGNDRLKGGAGQDALDGFGGNDKLWCGSGSDFVVLNTGAGKSKIFDLTNNDKFFLGDGLESFGQLDILQRGSRVFIKKDGDLLAIINNFDANNLTTSDFTPL